MLRRREQDQLAKNLKKAADGTWKVGIGVATEVLKTAAIGYYGLK
jgi:hypothetical protein